MQIRIRNWNLTCKVLQISLPSSAILPYFLNKFRINEIFFRIIFSLSTTLLLFLADSKDFSYGFLSALQASWNCFSSLLHRLTWHLSRLEYFLNKLVLTGSLTFVWWRNGLIKFLMELSFKWFIRIDSWGWKF